MAKKEIGVKSGRIERDSKGRFVAANKTSFSKNNQPKNAGRKPSRFKQIISQLEDIKLKGEDLFYYFTNDYPDEDYRSVVALLIYAVNEPYAFLEKCVKEGKTLIAVYPGIENVNTAGMEYVGEIPDGVLYLK